MNVATIKALFLDALYQVFDNWVFRILLVLTLVPILMTFAIGFREDEIVLMFGIQRWPYEDIIDFFQQMTGGGFPVDDPQTFMVNTLSAFLVNWLAGSIGIIITIAATAFFVPRMIEKGAADVFFHKPTSRLVLYLSRYVAGLLFVGILSVVLVIGMYLGFLISSGHSDPGILWAALTLTYLFGLIHCVAMLIGVATRSTVASILLTLIFFFGNGCIFQQLWIQKEQFVAMRDLEALSEDEDEDEESDADDRGWFLQSLIHALDVFHYALPKTTDADYITLKLRKAVERSGPVFQDEDSGFVLLELSEGTEVVELDSLRRDFSVDGFEELYGRPVFAARDEQADIDWSLWRRERRRVHVSRTSERLMAERSKHACDALVDLLRQHSETVDVEVESDVLGAPNQVGQVAFVQVLTSHLVWRDPERGGGRTRQLVLFPAGDWVHTLECDAPDSLSDEERRAEVDEFLDRAGLINEALQGDWYGSRLGWTSEWKYNIFFSIGSSLVFALAMLLLGWWRLSRIDF